MLVDATDSAIYMCGMAPLDLDDPFFDIFQCDPTFDCDSHFESEFYTSKIQPSRVNICCRFAGKYDYPFELINTSLKAPEGPYSFVLHFCEQCLANGCHVVVRGARQNAQAKQAKLDAMVARAAHSQEVEVIGEAAYTKDVVDGTTTPSSAKKGRKRKANATNSVVFPAPRAPRDGAKNGRMRRITE